MSVYSPSLEETVKNGFPFVCCVACHVCIDLTKDELYIPTRNFDDPPTYFHINCYMGLETANCKILNNFSKTRDIRVGECAKAGFKVDPKDWLSVKMLYKRWPVKDKRSF